MSKDNHKELGAILEKITPVVTSIDGGSSLFLSLEGIEEATQSIEDFYRNKILEIVNLYGNPRCDNLHHSKKDRHTIIEDCPVEKRIEELIAQFNSGGSDE